MEVTMSIKIMGILSLAIIILAGCAAPMVPREVMSTVTQPPTTFREIQGVTDRYIGTTVIWGGQILAVMNEKDSTTIQILQEPLDPDGNPRDRDSSQGRFLVESQEYLDPEVYTPGRRITVVGKIKGKISHPLGEGQTEYDFPIVTVEHMYLWQKEPLVYPYPAYYGPPIWWGPYWGVGWDWRLSYGYERFHGPGFERRDHLRRRH